MCLCICFSAIGHSTHSTQFNTSISSSFQTYPSPSTVNSTRLTFTTNGKDTITLLIIKKPLLI